MTASQNTIEHNGYQFQIITTEDGKVLVKQQNRAFPNGGAEFQTVGRCSIIDGQITKRSGCLAMDDNMDAAILAAIA